MEGTDLFLASNWGYVPLNFEHSLSDHINKAFCYVNETFKNTGMSVKQNIGIGKKSEAFSKLIVLMSKRFF